MTGYPHPLQAPDHWLKFSAILPDFALWQERMVVDSVVAAQTVALGRHAYGPDPRQWVEYAPARGSLPAVPVMIHGGYWRALRAEDHRFVLPALATLGVGVANVEYRLMPGARMANLVDDVAKGLLKVARAFPDARILPIGHSAGAHLALAALLSDDKLLDRVAGVVPISGAFDLCLIAESFLQAELTLTVDEIERFSVRQVPPVPVLFVTGSDETVPFLQQAETLAAGAALWGRAMKVSPCHHMNVLHGGLTGRAALVEVLVDWLAGRATPDFLEVVPHDPTL